MSDTGAPESSPKGKFLNRKIGGVAVKWLLLIAGIAVVGGIVYRRYKASQTPAPVPTASPSPDMTTGGGDAYSTAGGTTLASSGYIATSGNGTNTSTFSTATSNAQWATAVANGLTSQGYAPLDVQTALQSYLAGTPLTDAQHAIINAAIAGFGSPPEGVIGASTQTNQAGAMYYVRANNTWALLLPSGQEYWTNNQSIANGWNALGYVDTEVTPDAYTKIATAAKAGTPYANAAPTIVLK